MDYSGKPGKDKIKAVLPTFVNETPIFIVVQRRRLRVIFDTPEVDPSSRLVPVPILVSVNRVPLCAAVGLLQARTAPPVACERSLLSGPHLIWQ